MHPKGADVPLVRRQMRLIGANGEGGSVTEHVAVFL